LPGHIRLAEYEVTLGIAQELSGSIQTLQNLPGSISYLLDQTAKKYKADYVLIDMSPSLSSINQNLLMSSDYFIVPTSPDYFSVMAIDSLTTVLPNWAAWSAKAHSLQILKEATYPFPQTTPKLLGTIIQNYRPRKGVPSAAFQTWIEEISVMVEQKLIPALKPINMMLPDQAYQQNQMEDDLCLTTISDFNGLIAKSQLAQTPVFALTPKQIGQGGIVLARTIKSQEQFKEVFDKLANKLTSLTTWSLD